MKFQRNLIPPSRLAVSMLLNGYSRCMLICVAAKLDLADHLRNGALGLSDLVKLTRAPQDALSRVLRGIVTCGLLRQLPDGRFELTPLGAELGEGAPGGLRDLAIRIHDVDYPAWGELLKSTMSGKPVFDSLFHMSFYSYLDQNPCLRDVFDRTMSLQTQQLAEAILGAYDFDSVRTIVDIGGGRGTLLAALLAKHANCHGILYDLPQALANIDIPPLLASRCDVIAGDFLQSIPSGGDIYILKHVLHNWNDQDCYHILSRCRDAMEPGGKLLIIDRIMPEGTDGATEAIGMDLTMMLLVGSAERTQSHFESLLSNVGLVWCGLSSLGGTLHLIETAKL